MWNHLKTHRTARKLIASLLQRLQKLPTLVRFFFHAPTACYARA